MIYLILIIVVLIAILLYFFFQKRKEKKSSQTPYIEALIAQLDKHDDLAVKKFKEAIAIDTDLVDAYIRLGNLYRKKGDHDTAIKIHQSLTVRTMLKKYEEKRVYYALVDDMIAIDRKNKAIAFLREILKIDKHDQHARETILKILEEMGQFADCASMYEESSFANRSDTRLAFYYALAGRNKLNSGVKDDEERDGQNLFRKALRIDSGSLTATFYLADHHEKKGDIKKAAEYYTKIINNHPDHAFLILSRYGRVMFELDRFEDIIPVYEKIFSANPKNFAVGFELAALFKKKSEPDRVKQIYQKIAEVYPDNVLPRLYMIQYSSKETDVQRKVDETINALAVNKYRCSNCGFTTGEHVFLCPKCHAIESLFAYL